MGSILGWTIMDGKGRLIEDKENPSDYIFMKTKKAAILLLWDEDEKVVKARLTWDDTKK